MLIILLGPQNVLWRNGWFTMNSGWGLSLSCRPHWEGDTVKRYLFDNVRADELFSNNTVTK